MAFLQLKNVCKGYRKDPREVLRDVSLDIAKGELVAIVGSSGSGKTTLLSILAGLVRPDAGMARLDGQLITGPGPERAVVFQSYSLLPWLTVRENVLLGIEHARKSWTRAQRRERADEMVALVNLTAARDKRPSELSGGMRQRVAVARALGMDPAVLLMDEPLSALDALTRGTLQDEIERIWERNRTTAVLVTNDVDEALRLADRIIPLSRGPGATLGQSIPVTLERPRDRRKLQHDPRYVELREEVIARLLSSSRPSAEAAPGGDASQQMGAAA